MLTARKQPCTVCGWRKTRRTRCLECRSLLFAAVNLQLQYGLAHKWIRALWQEPTLGEPSIPLPREG